MSRTIATIEGVDIIEHDDHSVSYLSKAHVDADGSGGNPHHDPYFQPETSLKHEGVSLNAEIVPYVVVPPAVVHSVAGIVLGCKASVLYGNRTVAAVVGDIGPATKLGEVSVACARVLGMNPSPINGGVDDHVVHYLIWPGVPAVVDGVTYQLQPAGVHAHT